MRVLVTMGTRPEVIKLAPVVKALRARPNIVTRVLFTGQHRDLLDQMAGFFGLVGDDDLRVMREAQSLTRLTCRLLEGLDGALEREQPDAVVVQGDTTTVMTTALACYYRRLPVAHVEAGLRTDDLFRPYPEEGNRRLTSQLTRWHFAPTETSRQNLLREAVPADRVWVTGNTVIDALLEVAERDIALPLELDDSRPLILLTLHRRESFGAPLRGILGAIRSVLEDHPDVLLVYPVHPNPEVQRAARAHLGDVENARLIEPLSYGPFVSAMKRATLIVTDSGGVQEEAPSLGVPVLVLRDRTERPEGVEAGLARLVGTAAEDVRAHVLELLLDPAARAAMRSPISPYGDGKAAQRIAEVLARGV